MNKKSRFKLAVSITIFLMLLCGYAVYKDMEGLATQCVVGLMIVGPTYIAGDSYRKSTKYKEKPEDA